MFDEGREGKGLAGDARTKMAFCKVNAPFLGDHVAESKSPGFFLNLNRRGIQQSPDSRKIWIELLNQEPGLLAKCRIPRIEVGALEP